jgi:hypothetical protein
MIITCDKCGEGNEGKLDLTNDKVICLKCKGKGIYTEIPMTPFFKQMMKDRRDILDDSDQIKIPPNGMLATCENQKCAKSFSAEVDEANDTVTCPYCKTPANISFIAKNMLRSHDLFLGSTARYFAQEGKEAVSIKENAANEAKAAATARLLNAKEDPLFGHEPVAEASEEELEALGNVFEGSDPALLAQKAVNAAELGKTVLEKGKIAPAFRRAE